MPAFYRGTLREFLDDDDNRIVGRLTGQASFAGFFQQLHAQTDAWQDEIRLLKRCAEFLLSDPRAEAWSLLLEYPIPRRGKRIDAVLVAGSTLVVMEFKCGAKEFARDAILQVEDYCLDLADFHKPSRGRAIVPVLVATVAPEQPIPVGVVNGPVHPTWLANERDLAQKLTIALERFSREPAEPIDAIGWDEGDYTPTPTIIEAAQTLYAGQNVREISRCSGGIENLTRTTDAVIAAVESSRAGCRKRICFITGVPGAGKTLAGLNIVHNRQLHEGDLGVFLSGNGPLVRVLTEALARDAAARDGMDLATSRRRVATFIQNVHRFIEEYFVDATRVPVDRVVIFDEAQRAWDADQSTRKFGRPFSEPEILLDVMDRHPDWAVIVALVGGGQEINRGEAGLAEWGRALSARFGHWEVSISPELKVGTHAAGACLFASPPEEIHVDEEPALHLRVNLRSYRAELLSEFVDAVMRLEPRRARELAARLGAFPLAMTRELDVAKAWLRHRRRGHRRIGLVASSGGRRLRAHGLDVTTELDVEKWFLNGPDDVRSSHYLELPATEFAVQGLELDWAGVCWGSDLYPRGGQWVGRDFRGTRWQSVHDGTRLRYMVNRYRVLLTRAREGMVIWVPPGDVNDPTRSPEIDDLVAAYLNDCGIEPVRSAAGELPGQDSNLEKQDQNLL